MKFPQPDQADKRSNIIDPILPLINVVFLLLIFVMLMSRVESIDNYNVSPPVSESEDPAGARETLVVLSAGGKVQINGVELNDEALQYYAQDHQRYSPAEVIKIKADAKVDATRLISVMENLRDGGVENLILLTEKRR